MGFLLKLEQLPFCVWLHESSSIWAFPMFLFMHTLGMSMIAGVSAIVDLAFLGFWPRMPVKPLERLYPLMWTGFWINAVTGTVLTIADASTRLTNPIFYIKMTFVFAGVALLYLMRKRVFRDPELDRIPLSGSAKGLAWASLVCWLGAITAGRLLAYLGPVSGVGNLSNHQRGVQVLVSAVLGMLLACLTPDDLREIDSVSSKITVQGARYLERLE